MRCEGKGSARAVLGAANVCLCMCTHRQRGARSRAPSVCAASWHSCNMTGRACGGARVHARTHAAVRDLAGRLRASSSITCTPALHGTRERSRTAHARDCHGAGTAAPTLEMVSPMVSRAPHQQQSVSYFVRGQRQIFLIPRGELST